MINAYLVDPIIIWKWNGYDAWGEPALGTDVNVKGYAEWKKRLVMNQRGENVLSEVTIHLPLWIEKPAFLNRKLLHEDMIQLYGESVVRAIIDIAKVKDFSYCHYEVYLA